MTDLLWEADICKGPKQGELSVDAQGMPEEIVQYIYFNQSRKTLKLLCSKKAPER